MRVEVCRTTVDGVARAQHRWRPRPLRTLSVIAVATATLTAGSVAVAATPPKPTGHAQPTGHSPAVSSASLAALQHQLDTATALAARTGDAVLHAAAESASLRISLDDLAAQQQLAQAQLNATAVSLYEQAPPTGLPDLESLSIDPGEMQGLVQVGTAQANSDLGSLAQASGQAAQVADLTQRSDKLRAGLVSQAVTVYAAQDKARTLIATLQTELLAQAKAAQLAKNKAAKAAAVAKLAALAAAKARLDEQSSQLSLAMSPSLSAAGQAALARQKPLLDTLVAAGSNYPAGYQPTGQTLTGVSSWYGPGFVGRDTASGTPYDPELLTCAMRSVPLGTVIRVTNLANNASVDAMVTDRGPYVGNRVIDLSHAAAVAIGNSGLATVRIEILAPTD
jgi:rare lipoprotein A